VPTALVTGTSTGIGEAVATRLAGLGWTVYAGVRRDADGDRIKARANGDVRPLILDVTRAEHIDRAITTIADDVRGRGLQALVNNAGVVTARSSS
jgi:NAD(P)-dependent dehydrogenase (short-subunit alcohol dehydrogenase family)